MLHYQDGPIRRVDGGPIPPPQRTTEPQSIAEGQAELVFVDEAVCCDQDEPGALPSIPDLYDYTMEWRDNLDDPRQQIDERLNCLVIDTIYGAAIRLGLARQGDWCVHRVAFSTAGTRRKLDDILGRLREELKRSIGDGRPKCAEPQPRQPRVLAGTADSLPAVPRQTPLAPYRISRCGKKLIVNGGEITLEPKEAKVMALLIVAAGSPIDMRTAGSVPEHYAKHISKVKQKLKLANLPDHIKTPGGPGRGSEYSLLPEPLSSPVSLLNPL
jgi:hypothetical protein